MSSAGVSPPLLQLEIMAVFPCRAAANSLHTMVTNYPTWRHSIVQVFVQFLLRDVPDSCPLVLEATLKLLIQFVRDWRQLVTSPDRQTVCLPLVMGAAS